MNTRKGQSAIEYILLVACFIAFLIFFLSPNGPMYSTIDTNINKTVDQIGQMAISTNFDLPPYSIGGGTGGGGNGTGGSNTPPACSSSSYGSCPSGCINYSIVQFYVPEGADPSTGACMPFPSGCIESSDPEGGVHCTPECYQFCNWGGA